MKNQNYIRAVHPWQRACIDRKANCRGCDNALPEFGYTCKIKDTPQVARKLGLQVDAKPKQRHIDEPRPLRTYTCEDCGALFQSQGRNTKRCPDCRMLNKRKSLKSTVMLPYMGQMLTREQIDCAGNLGQCYRCSQRPEKGACYLRRTAEVVAILGATGKNAG